MPLAAAAIVVDCKREDNDASVAHFAIFLDSPRIDFSRSSLASRSGDNFVHNFRLDFSYKLPSKVSPGAATILPFLFYYFFFFFLVFVAALYSRSVLVFWVSVLLLLLLLIMLLLLLLSDSYRKSLGNVCP